MAVIPPYYEGMNNETRPTIPVPASQLSDAALLADHRARRSDRLTAEELYEIASGVSLALTAKEEARAHRTRTRSMLRKGGL